MNEVRAEKRRQEQKARKEQKRAERRKALTTQRVKKQRRPASLRGDVQLLKRTIGGMLLEMRRWVAEIQQRADLQAVLNECLARCAQGAGTEEEIAVLTEFLADAEDARKALEADKPPAPEAPVGEQPVQLSESVFEGPLHVSPADPFVE